MRPDMKDLLVNTGRAGGDGYQRARFKTTDADQLPKRFSSSQFIHYKRSQGDRLRPLYRFLERNCGRPWAEVYSEICKVSDYRSVRGYHLLQHVAQYVQQTNTRIPGQRAYGPFFVAKGILWKERELTEAERHAEYLLNAKRFKWPKPKQAKIANPKVVDTADHWWEKIEGYWYEFTVSHIKYRWAEEFLIDKGNNVVEIGRQIRESVRDVTRKRQVDSKTIKKLEDVIRKAA